MAFFYLLIFYIIKSVLKAFWSLDITEKLGVDFSLMKKFLQLLQLPFNLSFPPLSLLWNKIG